MYPVTDSDVVNDILLKRSPVNSNGVACPPAEASCRWWLQQERHIAAEIIRLTACSEEVIVTKGVRIDHPRAIKCLVELLEFIRRTCKTNKPFCGTVHAPRKPHC